MEKKGSLATNLLLASSSSSTQKWKYEVFLSFRGEDTRNTFTSHLYAALRRKSINTFIDDKLKRGEEITSALSNVIEESNIGIIIFSDDYSSSTFCLDEVVKIIECSETHGQIVIPVFYHVDPSDVENQTGSFAAAFVKHEIHNFDRVQSWKVALSKAARMAGWHISGTSPEYELVENISNDIVKKLNAACSCDLKGLVGIKPRIEHIKALLFNESLDVRMLGIWGMGGIGKTTLAEAVFSQIKGQFDGCCFLPSVRINSEKDGDYIIKQLLFQIFGEKDGTITSLDIRCSTFIARMLNRKVLVVVDDVNSTQQLEFFVQIRYVFGKGSRIIVTSRDKHILSWCSVDGTYEVKGLDFKEAQICFCQNAFKNNFPAQEHGFLSDLFITYANGNPLGLKVLGSFLFGRTVREWKNAWDKLQKYPKEGIQNVLKISYDNLDGEEKDIFLHLACFFRGEKMDEVTRILNACGFSTDIALSVLIDKSLITVIETCSHDSLETPGSLEIHDLLQEMGKGIVREESREPGKRSRLWDHDEIVRVLKKSAGTEAIEAICLDMSKIDEIDINPDVFKSMSSLKLLKFYDSSEEKAGKVNFSQGLDCLPDELRYLYWHGYPLETLPANFDPVELVELHLPYSMNIKSLQRFDIPQSSHPFKVPMLLGARNLVHINMYGCARIETFPSTIGLKSLETLNLTRCLKLETFPEISSNVRLLDMSYTAIKIVPASLGSLCRLETFTLTNCTKLES
ncbi:disease resistance protein RPV1-like [Mercurialis annua]|uniref:disease resistance protein RPV1-like n=1 Tax=Mercurialis annua TaxID=3986 RepID=UPI00215E8F18|nr:disease resistance protein RPV1-like [Mercurialis annua]